MDYVQWLMNLFASHRLEAYFLMSLIAFAESVVVLGLAVPGVAVALILGFLAGEGYMDLGDIIWIYALGSIAGDVFSYFLGRKGKRLLERGFIKKETMDWAERFLKKHGNKSIFISRFIGPLRPMVPFIAGMFRMRLRSFLFWNILSAFVWSACYILLGYFFGQAWRTVGVWSGRISLALLAIGILAAGTYFIRKKSNGVK